MAPAPTIEIFRIIVMADAPYTTVVDAVMVMNSWLTDRGHIQVIGR
jgi:hypothetical protein